MIRALAESSRAKAAALAVLGKWLVPEMPFEPGFLLEGQRRVLEEARRTAAKDGLPAAAAVPVLAIGGFVDLEGVEGALREGFAGVQMARALIREPDLVRRWIKGSKAKGDGEAEAGNDAAGPSPCSHCNVCVLAALSPSIGARCVERDPEGGGKV